MYALPLYNRDFARRYLEIADILYSPTTFTHSQNHCEK